MGEQRLRSLQYLQQILDVPVGLIDNAWGGSSAEAWIRRSSLDGDPRFKTLMASTTKREAAAPTEQAKLEHEQAIVKWKEACETAKAENKPLPREPESLAKWLTGNKRAGNIFAGVVNPTLPFGIKGVIWYQGESINGDKALITLDCFGSKLRPFDVEEARGFALCGEDKVWHWAKGKIIAPDQVEISSPEVAAPIAVRYAWAQNPVCNLFSNEGLPVTPFRTDDFAMVTRPRPQP